MCENELWYVTCNTATTLSNDTIQWVTRNVAAFNTERDHGSLWTWQFRIGSEMQFLLLFQSILHVHVKNSKLDSGSQQKYFLCITASIRLHSDTWCEGYDLDILYLYESITWIPEYNVPRPTKSIYPMILWVLWLYLYSAVVLLHGIWWICSEIGGSSIYTEVRSQNTCIRSLRTSLDIWAL